MPVAPLPSSIWKSSPMSLLSGLMYQRHDEGAAGSLAATCRPGDSRDKLTCFRGAKGHVPDQLPVSAYSRASLMTRRRAVRAALKLMERRVQKENGQTFLVRPAAAADESRT
jgi:hypothetical protein